MSDRLPMLWNPDDEPDADDESPRAGPLELPPATYAITGRPYLHWALRDGYCDDTGPLDAPDYLPRGGIVAIDAGLAETMTEREP